MKTVLFTILLFLSGSLMFSRWIGLLLKKDLTVLNDGNPGATNLWQSAGALWGMLGVFLDFMKGYAPLAAVIWTGTLTGNALIPVTIAPILGHAFSPFMRFKGGKSKAVTFGVWSALTDFEVSVAYALILALLAIFIKLFRKSRGADGQVDACTSVGGMLLLGIYLFVRSFSIRFLVIWIMNLLIFIVVNRAMLRKTFLDTFGQKTSSQS